MLGCSFFRTNGQHSHNAGKPDSVPPGNPQNPPLPTPVIERKDKTSKSGTGFLKKEEKAGKKEGGREGGEGWKGVSSAF